jgi:hypothetical protein
VLSRLPLVAQKAILGQLVLFEVLERRRPELHGEDLGAVWSALLRRIEDHVVLELGEPQDGQSVDDYLGALVGALDGVSPSGAAAQAACDEIKEEARGAVAVLMQAAEDPLSRDSRTALDVAAAFHSRAGIEIPDAMLGDVTFRVGWNQSRTPHPYPTDQQVGGLTILSPRSLRAKVHLILVPSSFDWRTRLATSYVLLHELISHVFVGPWTAPVRADSKADARFAEGWMDTVAFQVHDEVMSGGHGLGAFGDRFGHQSARKAAARSLHDARYAAGSDGQAYGARDLGRDTANRVLDVFTRLPETSSDPLEALWRLSAALNTGPLPQIDRHRLGLALCRSLRTDKLSNAAPIISALRYWATEPSTPNADAWKAALKFVATVSEP